MVITSVLISFVDDLHCFLNHFTDIYSLDLFSGIFLHDPVSFVALVRPELFTFKKGVVRVETQGICVGHTLLDQGLKK